MEPRLKTSTKWSPFPEELCQLAASSLHDRFDPDYDTEKAQFVVQGRIYQEEILGRFGLNIVGQLKQPNFEISLDFDPEKEKALDLIQKSMDVVDHLWTELFEDDLEDTELALLWQTMVFEGRTWYFRYSTVNTRLEVEADRLLEEYEKRLVYEDSAHPDPLEAEISSQEDSDTTVH